MNSIGGYETNMDQIVSEMSAMGFVSLFFIIPAILLIHKKFTIEKADTALSDRAKEELLKHCALGITLFSGAAAMSSKIFICA